MRRGYQYALIQAFPAITARQKILKNFALTWPIFVLHSHGMETSVPLVIYRHNKPLFSSVHAPWNW